MLVVAILSVLMFSLLAAYLVFSNISKATTTAFVDSSSSFYAAESGLNRRAEAIRKQFLGFAQPTGTSPANIGNCISNIGGTGNGDFACTDYTFNYSEPVFTKTGNSFVDNIQQKSPYIAYTYVQPNPKNLSTFPILRSIPPGEAFAGLTAQEYSYRIYSTALRRSNNADPNSRREGQVVLQMDFNSRVIPLFQFAAFYQNDLEINPGADMTINGRVHTNANLRLSPRHSLNLLGLVTASGDIYNSIGYPYPDATAYGGWVKFIDSSGNLANDSSGNPLQFTTYPEPSQYVGPALSSVQLSRFGQLLQSRASQLQVPTPSFMNRVDTTQPGNIGEYYGKADLQLEFVPSQAVPFKLTAIKTGMTPGGCTGVTVSSQRQGGALQCSVLNEGQRRSLLQPVLVQAETGTQQASFFCPNLATAQAGMPSVNASLKSEVVRALQTAIVSQTAVLPYSSITSNLSSLSAISSSFSNNLNAIAGLTATEKTALLASTPEKIAAVNNGCFLPPAIKAIQNSFYDQREERYINLLQVNLRSLTAWNYYNLSVDWSSGAVTNTYGGQGNNTDELLFQRTAVDATAPANSLRGLVAGSKSFGAADTSEGGLVLHSTIDKSVYSYPVGRSPYGVAIAQGSSLPAPLTIASDQAIYLQGDYNNVGKQSAAVMGDSITVLSNACWDNSNGVKGLASNECGRPTLGDTGDATETTVNAAFLTRSDRSDPATEKYSGGLNNLMRFHEIWTGINFNYSGSLVSVGTPQEFSGRIKASGDLKYYMPPIRNWAYDTTFDRFEDLPPLSPRVIYLQQQVFKRNYN